MNLITDPWIPVLRRYSGRGFIAPHQITDPDDPPLALDAPRADFDGALMQFLIGLLQTVFPPKDDTDWRRLLAEPLTPDELCSRFDPLAFAFELDGSGPRFMQDHDRELTGTEVGIAALLIEAPGGNTLRSNTDFFVKRGHVEGLCQACAATAVFTLMTNAPAGGVGNRTSLRGGGPLTTLVCFDPAAIHDAEPVTLWQNLWLNVAIQTGQQGTPQDWFPWLSPTRTSEGNKAITQKDAHPAVVYWATPRRIRLDCDHTREGTCDICGQPDNLIERYVTRNYGANYTGWLHPLSPYYQQKPGSEWLPVHPQPGGFTYRYWPEWALEGAMPQRRVAEVVSIFNRIDRRHDRYWAARPQLRVRAFGFDMDNMKPRCWYEGEYPLFDIPDAQRRRALGDKVTQWAAGADLVRQYLTTALKEAWSGRPKDLGGDFSFAELAFWDATEGDFYELLRELAGLSLEDDASRPRQQAMAEEWHRRLRRVALEQFGRWVESGRWEDEDPGRMATAHRNLTMRLNGPKLKGLLEIMKVQDGNDKPKGKGRKAP